MRPEVNHSMLGCSVTLVVLGEICLMEHKCSFLHSYIKRLEQTDSIAKIHR